MRALARLRQDRQALRFFLAYGQSALGTGAGYVALLLVAYQRFRSPWALSLVMLADFIPPMLLAPVFGAGADRWSRRWCAVVADCVRGAAFIGIALTGSFALTVALALVAGTGTALFKPAMMAGLPELVDRTRLPQATALYGALTEVGYLVGPGLAALLLLYTGPKLLLFANAATFVVSGMLVASLRFGRAHIADADQLHDRASLLREASAGLALLRRMRAARNAIVSTSGSLLFGGMANVAELLLALKLGAGHSGYSLFVAGSGLGIGTGSLLGMSGGDLRQLVRRFLVGLLLIALGLAGTGVAPNFATALLGLIVLGLGNGMVIVYERLILQRTVSAGLQGRAFGAQAALDGSAFAVSYIVAGAILAFVGARGLFLIAGAGAACVWLGARRLYSARDVLDEELPATQDGQVEAAAIAAVDAHP